MLEEPRERRVERLVARPEARPREDALASELLHETPLGEDDGEHVAEGGQSNEYTECAFSPGSEHVAEEGCGKDPTASGDLFTGDGGEVGCER